MAAVLCGHAHWNEHNLKDGIAHIVNPAVTEWPNAYRVFRVYGNRLEWELRQVPNRGFVRESFVTLGVRRLVFPLPCALRRRGARSHSSVRVRRAARSPPAPVVGH